MYTIVRLMFASGLAIGLALSATPGEAVQLHTWVAPSGTDNSTCGTITSPCATFQGAYSNTYIGGEITCLSSGAFGGVNITNTITINCEYTPASVLDPNGTNGYFDVNLPAGAAVTLRGIDFDGINQNNANACESGLDLVYFSGGGILHLENMKISHLSAPSCGIYFAPTSAATLTISNCDLTDNGGSVGPGISSGIYIKPASGVQATVAIDHTRIQNNYFGIIADGTSGGIIKGTITDSVVSGNTQNGITVSSSGSSVVFQVDRTTVASNVNHGLVAGGSDAGILVSNTNVFNNGGGLYTTGGGALYSYGNNHVNGNNGNDGTFTGTIGQQ